MEATFPLPDAKTFVITVVHSKNLRKKKGIVRKEIIKARNRKVS
jgi:hypothetical protein